MIMWACPRAPITAEGIQMAEFRSCFYCDATLESGDIKQRIERDHFPVPDRLGGKDMVDSCVMCHNMKDRFKIESWSVEWVGKIIQDFPNLGRESRIFLAKAIDVMMDIQAEKQDG